MPTVDIIRIWMDVVLKVPLNNYVDVADYSGLPDRVNGDSSMWCERFFTPRANPHSKESKPKISFHIATKDSADLLRHEFKIGKDKIVIYETINYVLAFVEPEVPLLTVSAEERRAFILKTIPSVLNLHDAQHSWVFDLPTRIENGVRFSSNPSQDPLNISSWTDRADGGVENGALYFMCYKKFFQLAGYRDAQDWFGSALVESKKGK